jgi:hypothetical protein
VIRGARLARSIIENSFWEVQIEFSENSLANGFEEGIKAVRLL